VVSAGHAATAAMFTKLPYDTLKDFAGVSRIANALGADPAPTSPEGFDAYIRGEVAKFQKIVRDAGIKPE